MAHPNVETAVRSRLEAGFTACPIIAEGEPTAPDGQPFAVVQFPFNQLVRRSRPDRPTPMSGVKRAASESSCTSRAPAMPSPPASSGVLEIASLFRGKAFGGVRTWAPSSPVSDDRSDAAGYIRLTFAVPYDFDLMG